MKYLNIFVVLIFVAVIAGAYFFPMSTSTIEQFSAVNTGATANTSKVAETGLSLVSSSATSTSILNTDSQDRIIINFEAFCSAVGTSQTAYTGTGLANLTLTAATSSTAAPGDSESNTNSFKFNISTSSSEVYMSTSTNPANGADGRRWATGSYINFYSNATNTAQCIVDVKYLEGLGV